ncbi:ribbon-helix-helix domain-containing protein [Sandaracinobacter sp. RS1-74]|uniref:ribbon-helix-helix domain-containing protein n=1 Tax=Sandaracinobacteroides sayramensis TaxID=2913411 RepID=UPI001EDC0147|nr:ribbon-helix-helix domain-containing protein [Sandaracinobacteroides sayramensis]MCG2839627.1 ribbon-helix-helix domain-containing protein [Sandaracinobacteroides sayramensis]
MCQAMLAKRSFTIQGHRTSVALEPEFWIAFDEAVRHDGLTPTAWVTQLDEARTTPLASAIRVELLRRAKAA